jgi:hypothetical protein
VRFNAALTEADYGKPLSALQAIDASENNPQADALRKVLSSPPTPPGTGTQKVFRSKGRDRGMGGFNAPQTQARFD